MADDPGGGSGEAAEAKARVATMFGRMAPTYDSGLALFEMFGRGLVAAAEVRPGERVLDIACGRGACLRPAADAVGRRGRVLGVDLSPEMVGLTGEELRRAGVANAEVRVGDAEHLEVADGSVDVVLCGFCVFLFPQPQVALDGFHRVLRPGGRVAASIFADQVLDYPWVFDALDQAGIRTELRPGPDRSPLFTPEGLSEFLGRAGFDGISTTTVQRRFLFADVDDLLRWWKSHFLGPVLDGLSAGDLQRFRRECDRRLRDHRAPDGFELIKRVHFIVATRG